MRIIKVKENKNCITITYNSVTYSITKQAYLEYALFDGKEIDEKIFEEIINKDAYIRCFNYLTKCISSSIYSERALKDKAINKGYKEEVVDEVINKLKTYNYINDKSFINELILLYISNNKSNNEIAYILINKGYKEDDVISSLSSYSDELERINNLYEHYKNKYKENIDKEDIKNKIINYLLNKGYDYIDINKVVGTYYGSND